MRSKAEGERKVITGLEEKTRKRSAFMRWKSIVQKKEEKNLSNVKLSKKKQEAGIASNSENILRESKEEFLKALEDR